MPRVGASHDITLEYHDETGRRGYMLARDSKGKVAFRRKDAALVPPQFSTNEAVTQQQLPPEIEMTWYQEDWILGVGGMNDRNDPKRLAIAYKIDTSIPGVMRSARQLRTTALDTSETAPDNYFPAGFALAQGITDLNPVLWAFIGRDVYSWDATSSAWDYSSEPQNAAVIYKNGIQYITNVVAPSWYTGTDANQVAMPYIYKETATATYIASTLAQGRFKFMTKGRNSSGAEILWGGNNVTNTTLTLTGAHNNSTTIIACSSDPTAIIAVNDIIMVGAAGSQERMLVTAVTNPNLTVVRAYGDTAVTYSGSDKIYLYQPHAIRSSADPTNTGSWSSVTTVGVDDQPITGMVFDADNDILFVTKTDGIYSVNSDGSVRNLTPLFRQGGHVGNFMGAYSWNNHILLPMGYGGLLDFDYETLTIKDISLKEEAPEETAFHGVVLALHGDPTNLFALVKDLTAETLYFMKANMVEYKGDTRFRWSVLGKMGAGATITNNYASLMVDASRSGRRRVWMGFTEGVGATAVSELPRFYPFGNLSDDSNDGYSNDTDMTAETVEWDGHFPRMNKRFEEVQFETRNLGVGGRQIKVEYQLERDGNWHHIGTVNVSPFQSVKFPSGLYGKILELRFTPLQTSVTTIPVDLLSFRVIAQLRPDPVPTYEITVHVADQMMLLNGSISSKSKGDLDQLEDWNASAAEVLLYKPGSRDFV